MRLKGVKLPSYSKKGAMSVLHPFKNPDQPYKILRLQTVLSANASSDQKGCLPEALKNQIPIVLKGMHRLAMTESQTASLNRLPTLKDMDRRWGAAAD
eukprot:424807-Pyramimonas_sp.AAC.1